jgi:hypothetical protein
MTFARPSTVDHLLVRAITEVMLPAFGEGSNGVARSAARGAVGAMAQTAMRRVTTGLGLVRRPPPERLALEAVPALLARVPAQYRDQAIEVAHWGYGAFAGGLYAVLPGAVRRHGWAGPAYGIAVWLLFEAVLAPTLLGLERTRERPLSERLSLAADHALYGTVVGARM